METAPTPPPPPPEPSSLTDRLVGVIASPGEVFAEIKDQPVLVSNWLVPLILACIVTSIYIAIAFSQASVIHGMQDAREKAMQKQVAAGKLTQAQADQANALVERFMTPGLIKIFSVLGAIVSSTAGLFVMGIMVWFLLKFCARSPVECMKVIEVCGLALVIDVLQKILRSFLVLWKENMLATASPALFLAHPDATHRSDVFLSLFDVVDIWWLAVLTIGVSKVAGVSGRTAALITFGLWFGFRMAQVLLIPAQS